MRKTLTTLLAVVASVAAFGSLTGVAAADGSFFYTSGYSYSTPPDANGVGYLSMGVGCETYPAVGNLGQYGAWGYFVDGCTRKVTCPQLKRNCQITGWSTIKVKIPHGEQVTMNSRIRSFNTAGAVTRWWDASCIGYADTCRVDHAPITIAPGESASVQCNGVHAYTGYGSYYQAVDACHIALKTI
jgi:hypothetical protein